MAMVTIKKGNSVYKVSRKSFESMYKKNGYRIIGETEPEMYVPSMPLLMEDVDLDKPEQTKEVDIETIPISDMTKAQLTQYAKIHGIELGKPKSVSEARRTIQKAMKEE